MAKRGFANQDRYQVCMRVTAARPVNYNTYMIPQGFVAIVIEVDHDGDALVTHNGVDCHWLLRTDISSFQIERIYPGCDISTNKDLHTISAQSRRVPAGTRGTVVEVDGHGDAVVNFHELHCGEWISIRDFCHLSLRGLKYDFGIQNGAYRKLHHWLDEYQLEESYFQNQAGNYGVNYSAYCSDDEDDLYYPSDDYDAGHRDLHSHYDECEDHYHTSGRHRDWSSDGGSPIGSDFSVPSDFDGHSCGSCGGWSDGS